MLQVIFSFQSFQGQPSPLQMTDLLQIAVDVSHGCEYLEMNHISREECAAVFQGKRQSGKDWGFWNDMGHLWASILKCI